MASCGSEKQISGMVVARLDVRNILFIFKQLRDNLCFERAEDRGTLVPKPWLDRFAGNSLFPMPEKATWPGGSLSIKPRLKKIKSNISGALALP